MQRDNNSNNKINMEIISDCCGASLLDLESDICSDCLEHCEAEII